MYYTEQEGQARRLLRQLLSGTPHVWNQEEKQRHTQRDNDRPESGTWSAQSTTMWAEAGAKTRGNGATATMWPFSLSLEKKNRLLQTLNSVKKLSLLIGDKAEMLNRLAQMSAPKTPKRKVR